MSDGLGFDYETGKHLRIGKVFGFWKTDQLSKTMELLQPYFDVWSLFKVPDLRRPLSIIKQRLTRPCSVPDVEDSVIDDTSFTDFDETS